MQTNMRAIALAALLPVSLSASAATTHLVTISGFEYVPDRLTIVEGDTVEFEASGSHPLLADNGSFKCAASCQVLFSSSGEFGFYCGNHGGPAGFGMSGIVTVLEAPMFLDGFE